MDNLFRKAVVFTDAHWGRAGANPQALADNTSFTDWMIDEALTRGCETAIFCGDYFDNRSTINLNALHHGLAALERVSRAFRHVYMIAGNHDLFYRDKRDVASIEFAKHLPNVRIFGDPTTVAGVTFLPWLVGSESKQIKTTGRYVFAHLEVPGFTLNGGAAMPATEHTVDPTDLTGPEWVFTGHFHQRQIKGNISYIGSIMPFNFSDANDAERGCMFLDWGKDPVFVSWPGQPLYRTMRLSEMLSQPERLLRPGMTVRAALDIPDLSFEEAQVIRAEYVEDFGLRKVELVQQPKQEVVQEFAAEVGFQSLDQIIIDGLLSVQSAEVTAERLVDIYRSL